MKKIPFVAFVLLTSPFVFGQVQLTVGGVKAPPGSKILVPVFVSEGKDISGLQFSLSFDGSILSAPEGKTPVGGDLLTDHSVGFSRDQNKASVVIFSSSLSRLKAGAGTVLGVILQINPATARGTATTVRLTAVQASDSNGKSVAVSAKEGSVLAGDEMTPPAPGSNEMIFPQIANGSFPGGGFASTLIFVNRSGALTSGEVRFIKSDGSDLTVKLTDGRSGSRFTFAAAEGASVFLQTDGSGPLSVGYARVIATAPLGGTILFSQFDSGGQSLAEAGVASSPAGTRFTIPVLYQKGAADTGIAFANVSSQAVELSLTLRDGTGQFIDFQKSTLSPGQHLPRFSTEFFTSLTGRTEFSGSIEVVASAPVSAVALKLQGSLITTFPVIQSQFVER